jgi:hypothetical protein
MKSCTARQTIPDPLITATHTQRPREIHLGVRLDF